MTGTLISLISIFLGIIAANLTAFFYNKYSFGFTGNTLIGVFGSIFLIKSFGKLGFDPWAIMLNGKFHAIPFVVNVIVSCAGGVFGIILLKYLINKKADN